MSACSEEHSDDLGGLGREPHYTVMQI